jgi:hypothetical protein
MGNNSSQLDYTKTSKTSYQLLEECRWKKPEYIIGELYQIEICDADASQIMRGHYNKKIIEEIFFPQFNVAVNQVRGYNIIPDAYSRFSNSKYPNSEPSKLIKKIKIDDCE